MDVVENTLVTTTHIAGETHLAPWGLVNYTSIVTKAKSFIYEPAPLSVPVISGGGQVLNIGMGAMNYPSTTQALFALVVMIIVLLFILVYCCWGTFSCARQEDSSAAAEDGAVVTQPHGTQIIRGTHMVIVPINNMIYVGDPESRRIYQIPIRQDKPPAYTEAVSSGPPPPYAADNLTCDDNTLPNISHSVPETRPTLPDLPPSYDACLSSPSSHVYQKVVNALLEQQRNQNHTPTLESQYAHPIGHPQCDAGIQQPFEHLPSTAMVNGQDRIEPEAPAGEQESVLLPSLRTVPNRVTPENATAVKCDTSTSKVLSS
nr:uncharacterized protein LOC123749048 isoform X1 [Procambarus clarkii]XP_045587112.1 uncharacterized protein LOC123749048 isoform X1 [Procambarus clarkii]XP_045587114.1 uncharacterized protein LOC123749048 isoform X1 [Procambarus clarkii]